MTQKTNSKKNVKKSNGNVHVSDKLKIKDNSEIKSLKRKLKKEPDNNESKKKLKKEPNNNESRKKKIIENRNSAEESKVFQEFTTNLSPKKRRKAKLGAASVSKKDVNAGDSNNKQVKRVTGHQKEEPDKSDNANHRNNVQKKKSVVCLACGDNGHKTANCSLLEDMEVVECCSKCLSSEHYSDDCSKVHGNAKSGSCRNCKDPNHTFRTCENECKFCTDNTDGHMRKDCPKAGHCHNCEKSGHYAYRCEEKCKYCNDNTDGHIRKDCPKPNQGKTCFNCNQNGHILKDCPNKKKE